MRSNATVISASMVLSGACALAEAGVSFQGLGRFPGTGFESINEPRALGISPDGQVVVGIVNRATGAYPGFRWTSTDGLQSLGPAFGDAYTYVTDASLGGGTLVGYAAGNGRAFRWRQETGYEGLPPLAGDNGAFGRAVDRSGDWVAGNSFLSFRGYQAAIWGPDGQVQRIGTLPGHRESQALAISNDGGTVVGYSQGLGGGRPFIWTAATGIRQIMVPEPAASFWHAVAFGVSDEGTTVVGTFGETAAGQDRQLFIWTEEAGFAPLATFPYGNYGVTAGVGTDHMAVAGTRGVLGIGNLAMYWRRDLGLIDLNMLLPALGLGLEGWQLSAVSGLSDDGLTIVGYGYHDGNLESWIAVIPAPGTAFIMLAWGLLVTRRQRRVTPAA